MKQIMLFFSFCSIVALTACEKSNDVMGDIAIPTGVGYFPVCTNGLVDISDKKSIDKRSYTAGITFQTELQFFSHDKIKEINLYNTIGSDVKTKISTIAYAPAYSSIKKLDTLLVGYTVPAVSAGTKIKLEYEILNENTLSVVRAATITVK